MKKEVLQDWMASDHIYFFTSSRSRDFLRMNACFEASSSCCLLFSFYPPYLSFLFFVQSSWFGLKFKSIPRSIDWIAIKVMQQLRSHRKLLEGIMRGVSDTLSKEICSKNGRQRQLRTWYGLSFSSHSWSPLVDSDRLFLWKKRTDRKWNPHPLVIPFRSLRLRLLLLSVCVLSVSDVMIIIMRRTDCEDPCPHHPHRPLVLLSVCWESSFPSHFSLFLPFIPTQLLSPFFLYLVLKEMIHYSSDPGLVIILWRIICSECRKELSLSILVLEELSGLIIFRVVHVEGQFAWELLRHPVTRDQEREMMMMMQFR